jgi:two-component system, chemotaxis family, sensor kinase CheA
MSQDPYKYFRVEARELVAELGKEVLALEKEPSPARIAHLLRLAHTLKGAARVVKQREIADHAHALEDALTPYRESGGPVPRTGVDVVLGLIDQIGVRVSALDGPPAPVESAARPQPEESFRTLRTDVAEVEDLLDGMAEVHTLLAHLTRTLGGFARLRELADRTAEELGAASTRAAGTGEPSRSLAGGSVTDDLLAACRSLERATAVDVDQMDRQLREVRQSAERMRLVAASALFTPLERAARDVAQAQGKRVAFEASGGDLRLDAHVLGPVQAALVQIVRNAVAHGIETEAERRAAGKPPEGRVRLEVARRGRRVAFICRDDGRGVDFEAVRRMAQLKGLVPADAGPLGPDALLQKLLAGGISTSGTVSEMAGRGIGLDVVRETKERLGGEIAVRTEPGRGTTIELEVPLSLASLEALQVEAGGMVVAIPLDAVRSSVHLSAQDIVRSAGGDTIVHRGRVVPFLPLARVLGAAASTRRAATWSGVLVEAAGNLAAVGVDRLHGTSTIVLRPLPDLCPADAVVAGAMIDGDGNPRLVLDPDGLVAAAQRAEPIAAVAVVAHAPILVIDDSLTTRMLEQSILESAGYDVEVAVSAEEGLDRARRERFALFLVDVEMPGMDGFSFIERTQADPTLRDVPAILVTSRNAPDDLRRGEEVGARGYIIKSEFNQGELLERIRSLVG